MSCNCNKAKPLTSCLTSLIIGEVPDTGVDYLVVLKTADGRTDIYDAANVYGTSKMAIEPDALRTGTEYEVWLTRADAANIEERSEFAIGDEDELTCVAIEFYQVHDGADVESFSTQEISLV